MTLNLKSTMAALIVGVFFTTPMAFSADEKAGMPNFRINSERIHPPLPDDAITVGCTGKESCIGEEQKPGLTGSVGVLENGYLYTYCPSAYDVLYGDQSLAFHNHPGTTVDLQPQSPGVKGNHFQGDWLTFSPEAGKGRSCVFLERIPPILCCENIHNKDHSFMPKVIQKARDVLNPGGQLVIHLAVDVSVDSSLPEQLEGYINKNPFCGYLNVSIMGKLEAAQKCAKRNLLNIVLEQKRGDPFYDAIRFYNEKMADEFTALANSLSGLKKDHPDKYKSAMICYLNEEAKIDYALSKNITESDIISISKNIDESGIISIAQDYMENDFKSRFDLSSNDTMGAGMKLSNGKVIPHALLGIMKIFVVFKQQEHMINYLNRNGFEGATLEWLTRSQHSYNRSSGFFITATRKD